MCPERWGYLVYQVYVAAAVRHITYFPVELDTPLPQDACLFIIPFGVCRLLV